MTLPSTGIVWKNYRNSTPTFSITSVEKPDLSPYLIHMTGKKSLVAILSAKTEDGKDLPEHGFLKSVIPSSGGHGAIYTSPVVCFTETPLFALDFFRYRSYRRWQDDQKYGLGFSKDYLIYKHQVRPVISTDSATNSHLLRLANNIIDGSYQITDSKGRVVDEKDLFNAIKPLLFPILEDTQHQGFMWEREWRCPLSTGIIFPFHKVEIICCPKDEKQEIMDLLGSHGDSIQIVESWKEYDEVTEFLNRRSSRSGMFDNIPKIEDFSELKVLKQNNEQTLNSLEAYYKVFKNTADELDSKDVGGIIEGLRRKSAEINEQIKVVLSKRVVDTTTEK